MVAAENSLFSKTIRANNSNFNISIKLIEFYPFLMQIIYGQIPSRGQANWFSELRPQMASRSNAMLFRWLLKWRWTIRIMVILYSYMVNIHVLEPSRPFYHKWNSMAIGFQSSNSTILRFWLMICSKCHLNISASSRTHRPLQRQTE